MYATFIQYKGWQNYQPEYLRFGLKTANNMKYLRFFWESFNQSKRHYDGFYKSGPSNKWFGNLWLSLDYEYQKKNIANEKSSGFSGVNIRVSNL